ncbi:hypothetical protein [Burkholderia vietnamiensis]|uniref:hypothetical protein n=1 Tax=Burkholderia vietnamiensis TaxID=60552 RepID=UPI001593627F|nr:hypothetical protein [Burkholderia vietnamiensis]
MHKCIGVAQRQCGVSPVNDQYRDTIMNRKFDAPNIPPAPTTERATFAKVVVVPVDSLYICHSAWEVA